MKKLVIAAALLLAACGKDVPEEPKQSNDIAPPPVAMQLPSETAQRSTIDYSQPIVNVNRSADGFQFKRKQFTLLSADIKMVYYQHASDLNAAYKARNGTVPHVLAFSQYKDGFCEIHVLDPSVSYEPQLIGHELMHCFHGNFHDPK